MRMEIDRIRSVAKRHGYSELDHQQNIYMVSFGKNNVPGCGYVRMNVYYSKGTVTSTLTHPKKGRNQMVRKQLNYTTLDKLFANPRAHAGDWGSPGYRMKPRPKVEGVILEPAETPGYDLLKRWRLGIGRFQFVFRVYREVQR